MNDLLGMFLSYILLFLLLLKCVCVWGIRSLLLRKLIKDLLSLFEYWQNFNLFSIHLSLSYPLIDIHYFSDLYGSPNLSKLSVLEKLKPTPLSSTFLDPYKTSTMRCSPCWELYLLLSYTPKGKKAKQLHLPFLHGPTSDFYLFIR